MYLIRFGIEPKIQFVGEYKMDKVMGKVETICSGIMAGLVGLLLGLSVPLIISLAIRFASIDKPIEQEIARAFLPLLMASILGAVALGFIVPIFKNAMEPVGALILGYNATFLWWLYQGSQLPEESGTMFELLMQVHLAFAGILIVLTLLSKIKISTKRPHPGRPTE